MVDEDIAPFAAEYLSRLAVVIERVDGQVLSRSCRLLREALVAGRRLCAVGNGGSSAIARAAAFQLRCQAHAHGHRTVVLDVGDQYEIAYWAERGGYASALTDVLWRRGLAPRDVVIVISMSGRSANMLALAEACRARGVRVLAFSGGEGGALAELSSWCVSSGIDDQQISEDAVLAWLTLAIDAAVTGLCEPEDLRDAARRAAGRIRSAAGGAALPGFLRCLSTAVTRAMLFRRAVFVVCGQGGPLGWVAEHIAHNLYWDVPTGGGVLTPAVVGASSVADLTAIHNDHPDRAHGLRYRLAGLIPGDVVCGIASDTSAWPIDELLSRATARGAVAHLITSQPVAESRPGRPAVLTVDSANAWELSTVVQPIGHLLCRLAAQQLRDATHGHAGSSLPELLAADLAPRRAHRAVAIA